VFQSTPAIAGGRTDPPRYSALSRLPFQSTPSIAGGRTLGVVGGQWHVRKFQSTPAIAGGRTSMPLFCVLNRYCFNPRPPLLAGERGLSADISDKRSVSIHARHCWRANRHISCGF